MKVMLVLTTFAYLRYFESMVSDLAEAGHEIVIVTRIRNSVREFGLMDKLNPYISQGKVRIVEENLLLHIQNRIAFRNLAGYANYFRPRHPSYGMRNRFLTSNTIPSAIKFLFNARPVLGLLKYKWARDLFKVIESGIPPINVLKDMLTQMEPDVVIAAGFILLDCWDVEYIKAAKAMSIPTIVPILSWDNLLIKGTFTITPDIVLVWNKELAEEAMFVHDIPRENLQISGAPVFDYFFDLKPKLEKVSFQLSVGLPADAQYLLYLGSGVSIVANETENVIKIVAALQSNPKLRNIYLLVRPHPYNAEAWKDFHADHIHVWPGELVMPITDAARLEFFHALYFSEAVVGVNTSAMLESAILDKPCVTILSTHGQSQLKEIGHFHHLLEGDFLYAADNFEEAIGQVQIILEGGDTKSENRKNFVGEFIRPFGMDLRVGSHIVHLLEKVIERA